MVPPTPDAGGRQTPAGAALHDARDVGRTDANAAALRELGRPAVVASSACPYLISDLGGWRLAVPAREHRCSAFLPPAALAPEKQGRLCLTAAHGSCATYLASVQAREERLGVAVRDRTTRWALARNTSVIEEAGGPLAVLLSLVRDRRRWPAIPAVLLVTTLLTLAISGFRAEVPGTAVATQLTSSRPTPLATPASQETSSAPTPPESSPPATPAGAPSPAATGGPITAPTPAPSYRTYKVKSGDTMSVIAAKFGTTVKAIADLNGITDPARLHIGQVLLIP